jgi:23S rRNA (adenine-N6)-dimethyltransferase
VGGPSPRWGWHQLQPRWAARLVADAAVAPGALVLDIGAGLGAVTAVLLAGGARVIAVEAHPTRARALRDRFGDAMVVVQADAADLRLPRRPYHVVANPPFAVSTAVLRRLLQPGSRLCTAHLVLPRHAAARWASRHAPAHARWSRTFAVGRAVPASAFWPPAPAPCRVLVIRRR